MRKLLLMASGSVLLSFSAQAAPLVEPGRWTAETRIIDFRAPQLPPQVASMMSQRPMSVSYCITPEEAEAGPKKLLEQSQKQNGECKFTEYDVKGQNVRAVMECKSKQMGAMRIAMDGNFTATSYQTRTVMDGNGPFQHMTSVSTGKRTGACK